MYLVTVAMFSILVDGSWTKPELNGMLSEWYSERLLWLKLCRVSFTSSSPSIVKV